MKRKNILRWTAALLILCSLGELAHYYYSRYRDDRMYRELAKNVKEPLLETPVEETPAEGTEPEINETKPPYLSPVDFASLWDINPDVVGWIRVPDTRIDYPILYDENDNEKYLHIDMAGEKSVSGSIYLDKDDLPDFASLHNVIYGHHMKDGSMFRDIMNFRDKEFFDSHREIYIYLPDREVKLRPFACLYTKPDGIRRKTRFSSEEKFNTYIEEMVKGAEIYAEPDQKITRIYSLVTCSYELDDTRTILYCYEVIEDPDADSTIH